MGIILTFIVSFALWSILTWPLDTRNTMIGMIVSFAAAFLFHDILNIKIKKLFQPKRYLYFVYYILFLLFNLIMANIDIAFRVFKPVPVLNPGIIKIKTNLKGEVSQTFLANSLTLFPGTMTVDIKNDHLYLHWMDVKTKDVKVATNMISRKLEGIIKEIFE